MGGQEKAVFLIIGLTFSVFLCASLVLGSHYSVASARMKNNNNEEVTLVRVHKLEKEFLVKGKKETGLLPGFVWIVRTPSVAYKMMRVVVCYPFQCCVHYGTLPPALFRLFLADLFSWMTLHCHGIYFTDFVGKVIFAGHPEKDHGRALYDEGVRWGSWGMLLQSFSAAIYAGVVQERLVRRFGQRAMFLFGLLSFTLSMVSLVVSHNLVVLQLASLVSGFGTAAVTTIPYDILTEFCKYPQVYYPGSVSSSRGVGENMAVLDAASFLAQVLPAIFMGYLVDLCGSASVYVIVTVVCGVVASVLGCYMRYPERLATE